MIVFPGKLFKTEGLCLVPTTSRMQTMLEEASEISLKSTVDHASKWDNASKGRGEKGTKTSSAFEDVYPCHSFSKGHAESFSNTLNQNSREAVASR